MLFQLLFSNSGGRRAEESRACAVTMGWSRDWRRFPPPPSLLLGSLARFRQQGISDRAAASAASAAASRHLYCVEAHSTSLCAFRMGALALILSCSEKFPCEYKNGRTETEHFCLFLVVLVILVVRGVQLLRRSGTDSGHIASLRGIRVYTRRRKRRASPRRTAVCGGVSFSGSEYPELGLRGGPS